MLICMEGLDGSGKSTISKIVANNYNLSLREKQVNELLLLNDEQAKKIIYNIYNKYSKNVQAFYYMLGFLSVLEDSKKEDIILDRGILSTYYFSFNEENKSLFDMFIQNYGLPDMTIVLYASAKEREKRIKNRDCNDLDLRKRRLYGYGYKKLFEGIKNYNFPYLIIDTDNMSIEEVSIIVNKLVGEVLKNIEITDSLKQFFSIDNYENVKNLSFDDLNNKIDEFIYEEKQKNKCLKNKIIGGNYGI